MENLMEFLAEQYLYFVPALWIIGSALKRTPNVPDWTIPWILTVLGVTGAIGMSSGATVEVVVQGVIAAGVAVYGHQLLKQTVEKG